MRRLIGGALAALDVAVIALALAGAWLSWATWAPNLQRHLAIELGTLWRDNPWMPPGWLCAAAWLALLYREGLHDPRRFENSVFLARGVTRASVGAAAFVLATNFLLGQRVQARMLVLAFLGEGWILLLVARLLAFRLVLRLPRPPTASRAAIVGTDEDAVAMATRLRRDARHVTTVVGFLASGPAAKPNENDAPANATPVLGSLDALVATTNAHDLDTLVLATRSLGREDALRLAVRADQLGLRVLQAPFGWGVVSPRIGVARVGGVELVDLAAVRDHGVPEQAKRAFDIGAVLVGGALLTPILILLALAVRLQDGGPVLYASRRVGRGGRAFDFYKFRTMVVDAEALREGLPNESDGRLFKLRDDPRVTPLGRWLRRSSLDELPQLWNVLRGDMHLVGPRPLPEADLRGVEDDAELAYWFEQRHRVRPGITGAWQVAGRSALGFAEMVRHDIRYIQDWSLWLDLQLLAKTVPAVLRGRGAS